ncbi:hypothetical protein CXB51_005400 [Gossypium anomalum]|uniref:Uncharacterized protein n=1 Tax=Gossypium anomalum TaxID=47600 RepID=A0A8J5ZHU7_9ROSI|nr:hypothetical protein CXB51_005400 [Gossypium anomalum]
MIVMVSQKLVSKFENSDADGVVVEVKRPNNCNSSSYYSTPMVLSDTDEYHAIFKNKLHQVRMVVAFSHALGVKVGGSSAQVPSIQEWGEPDYDILIVILLGILASTLYFVHWYSVIFGNSCKTRALDYLGSELFKSSSIVYACCSPHILEERVVLLENGTPFLFDLVSYGVNLRVLWDDLSGTKNYKWLGIEYNLHPRILELMGDGFQCVLASKGLLLLCDVRTPMVPLLCWAHDLDNPCFIDVIRSQFRDDTYQWATKSYFYIILGSFWNCEFKLFCYGPSSANEGYDSLLYFLSDDEYEIHKRFNYVNLDYFHGYLNDNLVEGLGSKMQKSHKDFQQKESFTLDFHEILCEKLTVLSCTFFCPNNISLPISICEVSSRQMWETFPLDLLLLAFSSHFELLDVAFDDMTMPMEFSVVSDLPQLPSFLLGEPSCRNIKWSHKMQLVGPILPLPILLALYEFRNGCPNSEKMFNEVMRVITEMAILDFCLLNNDESPLLLMIWVNSLRPKQFLLYYPAVGKARGNWIYNDLKFTTMITKVHKVADPNDTIDSVGLELFDDLCPIEFKFDVTIKTFVLMNALCLIEESVFMVILLKIQELFLSLILEDKDHFEVDVFDTSQSEYQAKRYVFL